MRLFDFYERPIYCSNALRDIKCIIKPFNFVLNILLCDRKLMYFIPRYNDMTVVTRLIMMDTEALETPNEFAVFLNLPSSAK